MENLSIYKDTYNITTACDDIAALGRVGIATEYITFSAKNVDMIFYISSIWHLSNFPQVNLMYMVIRMTTVDYLEF